MMSATPPRSSTIQGFFQAWRKWAVVLLGAHLFGSPWIFGVFEKASSANAWVVGVCLVVAALRVPVVSGPLAAELVRVQLGLWLLMSPFALGFAGSAGAWNAWVVGALTIAFADFPGITFAVVVLASSRQRARRLSPQQIVGYGESEGPSSPGQLCWHIVERSHQIHENLRRNPSEVQVEACILGHGACMHDLTLLIEHIADLLPKSGPLRRRKLGLVRWVATRSDVSYLKMALSDGFIKGCTPPGRSEADAVFIFDEADGTLRVGPQISAPETACRDFENRATLARRGTLSCPLLPLAAASRKEI